MCSGRFRPIRDTPYFWRSERRRAQNWIASGRLRRPGNLRPSVILVAFGWIADLASTWPGGNPMGRLFPGGEVGWGGLPGALRSLAILV